MLRVINTAQRAPTKAAMSAVVSCTCDEVAINPLVSSIVAL